MAHVLVLSLWIASMKRELGTSPSARTASDPDGANGIGQRRERPYFGMLQFPRANQLHKLAPV
jgi:hypothetical protein